MWDTDKIREQMDGIFNGHFERTSPEHYRILTRNIVVTMLLVTILPLTAMIVINHVQYGTHLRNEIITPQSRLANKTKHSFELFLEERLSTVRFIANAYSYDDLLEPKNITKILAVLKNELGGFMDLGVIDPNGDLVSYAGPYALVGKNYTSQRSFQEVQIKGKYISNVFMGHRQFPHIVVAVQHLSDDGSRWILRATIDTERFYQLINSMGLAPESDAFLINRENILQTDSRYFGKTLEKCALDIPIGSRGTYVLDITAPDGKEMILTCAAFANTDYILVVAKPRSVVLKSWYALKTDSLIVFAISIIVIVYVVLKMTKTLVSRIKRSDERRENALTELQHNQKLSSIGRLAAGVAHEVNNPLAIINEKAGLMNDLIDFSRDFNEKERFRKQIEAIIGSVSRCKTITHRLLGFAKRLDILIEPLNINDVVTEVMGFLEREALYRKIDIRLALSESLHQIESDRGQLQQVFLNLLTNAFGAVEDGGIITISSGPRGNGSVYVSVKDNGSGMSDDVLKHIFAPFFSIKKGGGTGLGLSITYGIIEKLGGNINVDSKVGKGTTFTVTLPVKP